MKMALKNCGTRIIFSRDYPSGVLERAEDGVCSRGVLRARSHHHGVGGCAQADGKNARRAFFLMPAGQLSFVSVEFSGEGRPPSTESRPLTTCNPGPQATQMNMETKKCGTRIIYSRGSLRSVRDGDHCVLQSPEICLTLVDDIGTEDSIAQHMCEKTPT